jgi:hypothetical protein
VVFLPYEVSGNEAISLVDVNFTFTGTLGLQSGLLGLKSVCSPTYYVTEGDFICFGEPSEIESLPRRCNTWQPTDDLQARQRKILLHLLEGSFEGDFFSFRNFRRAQVPASVKTLARNLGEQLRVVIQRKRTSTGVATNYESTSH